MFVAGLALLLATTQQRTDTLVVRGNADVPSTAVRSLVVEWKVGEQAEIGIIDDVAIASDGRVYLWDSKTPAIWQLSMDGKQIRQIGRKGAGPGEYDRLNGMTVRSDGKLVTWDGGLSRVNVYGSDGRSEATWPLIISGRIFAFRGLTATTDNRVLMRTLIRKPDTPELKEVVVTFDQSGMARDTTWVPRVPGEQILVARRPGRPQSSSSREVPFGVLTRNAMSPLGHVVYGPGRPYVFYTAFKGRPIRIERTIAPVPVSRDERDQNRARVEAMMRNTQPDWKWNGPSIPDTKPAYTDFVIGMDGRIWVHLSVESEKYTPDVQPSSMANQYPAITYRPREQRWDVFEPDGKFVARVAAPRRFAAYAALGDSVWGTMYDDDGVTTPVKMRIAPAR